MKIFETPTDLPFLFMKMCSEDELTLVAERMPVSDPIPFDDLFTEVDVSHAHARDHGFAKIFAVNVIANRIAFKTRRARGNMLFVPDEATKEWFTENTANLNQYPFKNVIVDGSLKHNELRCAYWRIVNDRAVDGGIQFSPDGFSCLPNYNSYFTKCFL